MCNLPRLALGTIQSEADSQFVLFALQAALEALFDDVRAGRFPDA